MSAQFVGLARGGDLTQIRALLQESGLPQEGLEGHPALSARERGRVVGSAALELARERGASRAYLLTETADGFFPRFGFRTIPRSEVSEGVRDPVEFVPACPQRARAMVLDLTEGVR